jgi:hypothetical protein
MPKITETQRVHNQLLLFKIDLSQSGAITIPEIPTPYEADDPWDNQLYNTYLLYQNSMSQHNRIATLVYSYYMGAILNTCANQKEAWKQFTQTYQIKNAMLLRKGIQRIHQLYSANPKQIYRSNNITFWKISRMSTSDFYNDLLIYAYGYLFIDP